MQCTWCSGGHAAALHLDRRVVLVGGGYSRNVEKMRGRRGDPDLQANRSVEELMEGLWKALWLFDGRSAKKLSCTFLFARDMACDETWLLGNWS